MNSQNNALSFLIGVGVGTVAAILFAPKSGPETREYLREKIKDGTEYAKQSGTDAAEYISRKADDLKTSARQGMDQAMQAVKGQRENRGDAGEQGYNNQGQEGMPNQA